jgi:phage terminase small subunit
MKSKPLTLKQARFVAEYEKHGNAKQAALDAGFSAVSAHSIGHNLLQHPLVKKALKRGVERALTIADVTRERVILELARLAFGDATSMLDDSGNLKPISELQEDVRRSISGIEVSETSRGERKTRVRTHDKARALETLAKYLGLLVEKVEISLNDDLSARLAAGRGRAMALQAPAIEAEVVRHAIDAPKEALEAETVGAERCMQTECLKSEQNC